MADGLWTYPDTVGRLDLTGFEVAAVDGDIGKIDEATHDVDASYFVVDTGMWIFGKKVLLPAGLIDRVDRDDEKVYVDRTKEEIENAPEFEAEDDSAAIALAEHWSDGAPMELWNQERRLKHWLVEAPSAE